MHSALNSDAAEKLEPNARNSVANFPTRNWTRRSAASRNIKPLSRQPVRIKGREMAAQTVPCMTRTRQLPVARQLPAISHSVPRCSV